MDATGYADWDNDGLPDHVMGSDGLWHAFNPHTGEMIAPQQQPAAPVMPSMPTYGLPPSAALGGGNIPSEPAPTATGGGARGQSVPYNTPRVVPPATAGSTSFPAYQGGSRHPFFGGPPRVPGGVSASGYSTGQQQVYVPGGAAAGPYKTAAARPSYPSGSDFHRLQSRNGYSPPGGSSGGGASDMYWKLRNKLMGGGSSSSGYSSGSYSYPSYSSSSSSYEPYQPYEPETPKMKGWASRIDPEQAAGLYGRPSMLMPLVSNIGAESPFGDRVAALPMNALTQLMGGNRVKAPTVDIYGNLTAEDQSLSSYTNTLRTQYNNILNKDKWFDYDQMARNLTNAKPGSALGSAFHAPDAPTDPFAGTFQESTTTTDPTRPLMGSQAGSFLNYSGALFGATLDPRVAASQQDYASTLVDRFASRGLTKSPKHSPNLAQQVGRRLFYT